MSADVTLEAQPSSITQAATSISDIEHIRPDLRARLAPLEAQGLLAAGVRAVLQENGYGVDPLRRHCGCQACARQCSVCERRYHGRV